MNDAKKNACAHENCSCPSSEGKYCSTYCETAKDTAEIACGCGHPNCAGKSAGVARAR